MTLTAPMTLGNTREHGVRELDVLCLNPACHYQITFNADDYADEIEVSWFPPRMIWVKCGKRVDVQPNWNGRPEQLTKLDEIGRRSGDVRTLVAHVGERHRRTGWCFGFGAIGWLNEQAPWI